MKHLSVILLLLLTGCYAQYRQHDYSKFISFEKVSYNGKQIFVEINPEIFTLTFEGDSVALTMIGEHRNWMYLKVPISAIKGEVDVEKYYDGDVVRKQD